MLRALAPSVIVRVGRARKSGGNTRPTSNEAPPVVESPGGLGARFMLAELGAIAPCGGTIGGCCAIG
jgi:hypothetical protein